MASRMFRNPFSAQPGHHEGRSCIIIVNEQGVPTGKYCFSEEKASSIIEKLHAAERSSAPRQREAAPPPRPASPPPRAEQAPRRERREEEAPRPRMGLTELGEHAGTAYFLGRHKVYGLYVSDGVELANVPRKYGEDDVTLSMAVQLIRDKRAKRPENLAEEEASEGYFGSSAEVPRFGLQFASHLTTSPEKAAYNKALLRDIQMSVAPEGGHVYSKVDAARLLDRKDAQASRFVLTLFLRMFERQVEDERRAGDARYSNQLGFNKGDSASASSLVKYMMDNGMIQHDAQGLLIPTKTPLPPGMHRRIIDILSRYLGQVLDLMNEGVARTRRVVRTNPPRRRSMSRR